MVQEADKIAMFIPFTFVKGEVTDSKGKKRKMLFKGVASNMKTGADMDGEILDPNGFDYTHLLKSGHINWNHQASKDPMAIVGEPTSAKVVNNEFHIEGFLYDESELAQKIYKTAEMLEKSGSTRRLGFSVEGNATERDPINKKHVKKASIMNVAIAPTPKNAGTYMALVKGFEYDSVESLCDNIIVDVTSDGERALINKSFDIAIVKDRSIVISDEVFTNAVVSISKAIEDGDIVSGVDIIKSEISSFTPILNRTLWVKDIAN